MPSLDQNTLAQQYGFALAVLNSDPDLKRIFDQAVRESWDDSRFQAAVRNTGWFKRNGEAFRNSQMLKAADPGEYNAQLQQTRHAVSAMAAEMGAILGTEYENIARQAFELGWDQNQLKYTLSRFVKYTDGQLHGYAGQIEEELRARAAMQGVHLAPQTVQDWVGNVLGGRASLQTFFNSIDKNAESAYPHLVERLRAGETIQDIAAPYRETVATLLEIDPGSVTVRDPLVKQALAAPGEKGPQLKPLWQFEKDVRSDKRWLGTKNAQDEAMSTTRRILTDMGLVA